MSKKDKLIARFLNQPNDFTYQDFKTLLGYFGYIESQGKGSGVKFYHKETLEIFINFHKPHGDSPMKSYIMKRALQRLKEKGEV